MGRLAVSQVVGEEASDIWSQVAVHVSGGEAKWMVISLRAGEEEAGVLGKRVVFQWNEMVVEGGADLKETANKLVIENAEIEELVVGRLKGRVLEVMGYGEVRGVMQRKGEIGIIYEGKTEEWVEVEGEVEVGDRWLLGTKGLLGEMSETLLAEIMKMESVEEAGEELVTQVHAAVDSSKAAGVLMQALELDEVNEEEQREEEVTEIEEDQPDPQVYLKSPVKRRKMAVSIALILLVLLGVSVMFGWQRREANQRESEYQTLVKETTELLDQAAAKMGQNSPAEATTLAKQAIEKSESAGENLTKNKAYQEKVALWVEETKKKASNYMAETRADNVPVWLDFGLIKPGFLAQEMGINKGKLLVLDGQAGLLGSIEMETKEAELAGGGDLLKGASRLGVSGVRPILWSPLGVIEVNSQTKTTGYLVKAEGDEGEIKGVGIFAGNVYLLDAGKDEIWRYPGLSAGVGSRQRWLGAGVTPDLAEVVEMAIDGDIWLAFSSGKVERYRRGVKENFVISGLPDPIKGLNSIFTNEDCEKVYLFEKGQTRVVAIDKEGKYVKQYSWPGMGQVTDLAVSESLGKIYLLSGSSIYALDL